MVSSLGGIDSGSAKVWEKRVGDANNIDEIFSNARDIGFTRLNQYRTTVVGKLAKFDSMDLYKVQIQSKAPLGISVKSGVDEKDMNMTELGEKEDNLLDLTSMGLRVEVYTMKSNGKEVLIADSGASEGSRNRVAMDSLLTGEYKANQGDLYIKISRDKTVSSDAEIPYVVQFQQGKKPKHDYIVTETISQDTANKKISKIPTVSANGALSGANAMQIIAMSGEGTMNMLSDGALNLYNINLPK